MEGFVIDWKNGLMVIKKIGITIPPRDKKPTGGLPTTFGHITPKK